MFSLDAGIAVVAALQQLHTHGPQIGLGNFTGRSPAVQCRALHFTHKEKQQQKKSNGIFAFSFYLPAPSQINAIRKDSTCSNEIHGRNSRNRTITRPF